MAALALIGSCLVLFLCGIMCCVVSSGISTGQLDEALPLLLPTLDGDLFGSVCAGVWFAVLVCLSLQLIWKPQCVFIISSDVCWRPLLLAMLVGCFVLSPNAIQAS
jgi:hypothetical protein